MSTPTKKEKPDYRHLSRLLHNRKHDMEPYPFNSWKKGDEWSCPNCGNDCGAECEGFANGSIRYA